MLRKTDRRDAIINLLTKAKFYIKTGRMKTSLYYISEAERQVKAYELPRRATYLSKG